MQNLIKPDYFNAWKFMLEVDIPKAFSEIFNMELASHSFTSYTSVSVMSSSKIEGEQFDIDSYVKHKVLDTKYLPELVEKPNDLYRAYLFAKDNKLTKANFQKAHKLITAHLLPAQQRGTVRKNEMLILEHATGRIQFEAALASEVKGLFDVFWNELDALLLADLTIEEISILRPLSICRLYTFIRMKTGTAGLRVCWRNGFSPKN